MQAALAVGVAGYLLKTMPGDELVGAIRAACQGIVVLDTKLSSYLVGGSTGGRPGTGMEALTSASERWSSWWPWACRTRPSPAS